MKNSTLILLLIILVITSCEKVVTKGEIIDLSYISEVKNSDIIKEFNFVGLETNEESIIGYIDKMQIVGDRIYILDIFQAKGLFIFDINGKYINKISRIGNGPGEFSIPISFFIDSNRNTITIIDNMKRRILNYNINTFEFVNEYSLDFYALQCDLLPDGNIIWFIPGTMVNTAKYNCQILITDHQGKSLLKFFPPEVRHKYFYSGYDRMDLNCDINISLPNETLIYKLINKDMMPKYTLKFPKNLPPTDFFIENEDIGSYFKRVNSTNYIQHLVYKETCDFACINYASEGSEHIGIYNKLNKKAILIKSKDILDDLGIGKYIIPICTNGDKFISRVYISDSTKHFHKDLETIIRSKKDDDNPILIQFKFKETWE